MNIARWFSYTRQIERELERERTERVAERTRLEEERQRIENVLFQSRGLSPPHQHLIPRENNKKVSSIPRAIGPFAVAARNAALDASDAADQEPRDAVPELAKEVKERVRQAATEKGLVAPRVSEPQTNVA